MIINHEITKEQIDTLRTNPLIQCEYPAQKCAKCSAQFQICLIKLGSLADMSFDILGSDHTQTLNLLLGKTLSSLFNIKPSSLTRLRIRIEDVHLPDLYAGKQVSLSGCCPACKDEIVLLLKKQ